MAFLAKKKFNKFKKEKRKNLTTRVRLDLTFSDLKSITFTIRHILIIIEVDFNDY